MKYKKYQSNSNVKKNKYIVKLGSKIKSVLFLFQKNSFSILMGVGISFLLMTIIFGLKKIFAKNNNTKDKYPNSDIIFGKLLAASL